MPISRTAMPSWKCRKLHSIVAGQISRNRFVDVQAE